MPAPPAMTAFSRAFTKRLDEQKAKAEADADKKRAQAIQDEGLAYARSQRPAEEARRKAATDASIAAGESARATRDRTRSLADREQQEAARRARTEGLDGLLDDLEAGMDPASATARYNARGTHKIAPNGIQYDRATGKLRIEDPEEGVIDTDIKTLRAGINADMERGVKGVSVGNGAMANPATGREMYRAPKEKKEEQDYTLGPGQIRFRGSKVLARGPDKPAPNPKGGGGGGGGGGLGRGQKASTFNPQSWETTAARTAGERLGGKYDGDTFIPKEGTSRAYSDIAARAARVGRDTNYAISPFEAANIVADAYENVLPLEEYEKQATQAVPYGKEQMLGNASGRASRDAYEKDRRNAAREMRRRAIAAADAEIDRIAAQQAAQAMSAGGVPAAEDETSSADAEEDAVDPGDEGGEEGDGEADPNYNPNDYAPARAPGAAAAPQRYRYKGAGPKGEDVELAVTPGLVTELQRRGTPIKDPRYPGVVWELTPDGKSARPRPAQ